MTDRIKEFPSNPEKNPPKKGKGKLSEYFREKFSLSCLIPKTVPQRVPPEVNWVARRYSRRDHPSGR